MKSFVISGKKNACINKLLFRFIIANVLGWIVYFVGYFADSLIGGNQLGEEALSAIEIVFPVYSLIYFVSAFVSVGCAIYKSIAIGKNDFKKADRIYSSSFYGSIVLGVILALLLWIFRDPFLSLYNLSPETLNYARTYYNPYIFIALVLPVFQLLYNTTSYDGNMYLCVIVDVLVSFSNIILSLIMVDKLKILGLSLATLISNTIPYFICILQFFNKTNTNHFKWSFSFKDLGGCVKFGLSQSLSYFVLSIGDMILNAYICYKFGSDYCAPYSVVNFILEISAAMLFIGQSMATIMTISFGENNMSDVKASLKRSLFYAITVPLLFTGIMIALACTGWLNIFFGIETDEFKKYVILASITISSTYVLTGLYKIVEHFKLSREEVAAPIIINLLQSFVFQVSMPILLSLLFGYNGFIIGFAVSEVVTCVVIFVYYLIKNKGKIFDYTQPDNEFSIDFKIDDISISMAKDKVIEELLNADIDKTIVNRVAVNIEEALLLVKNSNKKKKIFGRLVVNYEGDNISIFEKDNGVPFDLTNKDQKITNLNNYVYSRMSETAAKTSTYKAASLNSNHFVFSKDPNYDYSNPIVETF